MRTLLAIVSLLLTGTVAHASCNLNPRYVGSEIRWDSPAGSQQFSVQELVEGKAPVYVQTRLNSYPVHHRTSAPVTVRYIITAEISKGTQAIESFDACIATLDLQLEPDPEFRTLVRRAVIPIAGSTSGAFGGKFRTALELRAYANLRGRVVFHPANRVASDSDPSLPYEFTTSPVLRWNDVVEAMGQSGLGSIDIIPDEGSIDAVPQVIARLYNDTPIGTFGTEVAAVLPYSYLGGPSLEVPIPDAGFRVNIGIRTFTPTKMKVVTYGANGRLLGFRDVTFPAGWTTMTSAAELTRETLAPGASVTLLVTGSAIAFYTVTENRTNDPTVVVAPSEPHSRNVGLFVD